MKAVCISDSHNQHRKIVLPEGDLLIHAGDWTFEGKDHEVEDILGWFDYLLSSEKYSEIITIPGNHELKFATKEEYWSKRFKEIGVHLLINQEVDLQGFKFWGSPVTPWYHDWAFNLHRGKEIKAKWDLIPDSAEIVITHGPPMFFGDKVQRGHVGCLDLLEKLDQLPNLKVHVSGHIHPGYGKRFRNEICKEWDWTDLRTEDKRVISFPPVTKNNYQLINAAILDDRYKVTNAPLVFEL